MPTTYWLVGAAERKALDQLEAAGGVRAAEAAVDAGELSAAHARYAAERRALVPTGYAGPFPTGGVAGTRRGVKCLHAHYAWYLAGGDDPVGKWVESQLCGGSASAVAAIDCGTNSTRLLVASPTGAALERVNLITRLGQGVDRTGQLGPEAITRTTKVLEQYRLLMDKHNVGRVRMTATSAARDASNRDEFFDAAQRIVGVLPELLAGEEEGRLSFAGATSDLRPESGPWLVVDIGGGSTEMVAGSAAGHAGVVLSLNVGCVRLTERFLGEDPPGPESIAAARRFVTDLVDEGVRTQPALAKQPTLVGLAGTVSNLASTDQEIATYQRERVHHYRLAIDRVEMMLGRLARMTTAERRHLPGLEPERADVIVGGAIVLSEIMRRLGFKVCLTSEADILDGLVLSMRPRPVA